MATTNNGRLEGEAERKGEDVSVVLLTKRALDAVVWVLRARDYQKSLTKSIVSPVAITHHENSQPSLRNRRPDWLHRLVIESLSESFRAHDHASQVRKALNLVDGFKHLDELDSGHEWQAPERKQALLRERGKFLAFGCFSRSVGRAVRLNVGVELDRGRDGLLGREEVEPRVRERNNLGSRCGSAVALIRCRGTHTVTSIPWVSMNAIFSFRSQY